MIGASVVLLLTLIHRLYQPLSIHHDCAIYLQCGQLILDGKVPYVDFFESNPPLIMYISTIPAAMAAATGLHSIVAFSIFTWALAVSSTLACAALLARAAEKEGWQLLGPLLIGIAAVSFSLWVNFGQREHLFILSYLPFFLLRWLRHNGGTTSAPAAIAIGVAAGVGLSLKPYYLIVPAAIELYWLLKTRSLKTILAPEILACIAAAALYLAHFLFLPAAMQHGFFEFIMPLFLQGYGAFDCSLYTLLAGTGIVHPLVYAVIVVIGVVLSRRSSLLPPLIVWSLAAVIAILIQHKPWGYVYIPMQIGVALLAALECGLLVKLTALSRCPIKSCLASTICLVATTWYILGDYRGYDLPLAECGAIVEQHSNKNDRILFLSVGLDRPYPLLVQVDRLQACRYLWLFPIPMIDYLKRTANGNPKLLRPLEEREDGLVSSISEDTRVNRPKLIFVQIGSSFGLPPEFSLLDYLRKRGFIESLHDRYRSLQVADGYQVFKLEQEK